MDTSEPRRIQQELSADFDASEVKWKPQAVKGNRAMAVAYIDARVVADRLDDVVGVENWQDDYTIVSDGSVMCRLSVRIDGNWITKSDVGSPSEQPDGGDRLKAAFSDSLKRAASKFGVGRSIYRLPIIWADYDPVKKKFTEDPKLPAWYGKPAEAVARPAPAKPKDAPVLPANGKELAERIAAFDAKLAEQGLADPGALTAHVSSECARRFFSPHMADWKADQIEEATKVAKAYAANLSGRGQKH